MEITFLAERAASPGKAEPRFVVVDGSYRLHAEASAYLAALRGLDRSPNTERVYAGRLALFLSYCAASRISWQEIEVAALVRFLRWLVTEPLPPRGSESPVRYRRAATANAVLTTVCEFLRFGAARGWVPTGLVARLSHPKQLHHLPGHDGGEAGQFATVQARSLKLREVPVEVRWLTAEQVDAVIAATWRGRDRFLVSLLAATGMRIGEALGLRREDLHLLANGAPVGCSTDGTHLHIRRRRNENGAIAKSRYPRSVPVLDGLVGLYADYQHERFATAGADESDLVFVNLYRPPIGAGLQYGAARELFERLSGLVGFRVRPHMLRHSAASRWIESGFPRDVVQHLLGHASAASMEPYLHPTDAAKRAAVERAAARADA